MKNILMGHARHRLRFSQYTQAMSALLLLKTPQQLDGDPTIQMLIVGRKDLAHPTFTELAEQHKTPKPLPDRHRLL
jgi:hypothetical protein